VLKHAGRVHKPLHARRIAKTLQERKSPRMADTHHDTHQDPNAAPMRQQVREHFAAFHVAAAAVLGLVALAAGTVLGVVLAND
jgi:hypothetical protein